MGNLRDADHAMPKTLQQLGVKTHNEGFASSTKTCAISPPIHALLEELEPYF